MNAWILLVLLLAAAGAVLLAQRRRRRRATAPPLLERTLFDLRVGDIVQLEGRDWVVEDQLRYEEKGAQWLEYLLRDGSDARWLCVEEDDWLEVSWLDPAPPELVRQILDVGHPRPKTLSWEGITYDLRHRGRASLTSSARTLNRRVGWCHYGDYEGPEGRVLSLESWGQGEATNLEDIEVSLGRRIHPALVGLLPGDGRSVYR
ncbi:MAG: DUF4178 domain-containing protein [Cyanobacteriota bacterium]|jgi:hypothetical protein